MWESKIEEVNVRIWEGKLFVSGRDHDDMIRGS